MLTLLRVLWPALIPLLFYGGWRLWRARKLRRGQAVPPLRNGLFWALVASAAIAVLCLFVLGLAQEGQPMTPYHPSQLKDGTLVPGGFEQEPRP